MKACTHNLGALEPAMTPNRKLSAGTPVCVSRSHYCRSLENPAGGSEAQRRAVNFSIIEHAKRRQAIRQLGRDSRAELGPAGFGRYTRVGTASGGVCERYLEQGEAYVCGIRMIKRTMLPLDMSS